MKQVKVIVNKISGEISIETTGFKGKSCLEETKLFKELIGETETKKLTPAYFESVTEKIKKHLNLCG